MKLITLNTWGARITDPFFEFIKNNKDIDIYCFQEIYDKAEEKLKKYYPEVRHNIFSELKEILKDYNGFFRPSFHRVYGIAIFIKKKYKVLEEGEVIIYDNYSYQEIGGNHSRNLQKRLP